jgi:polyisoprenoid-binding protein YceI
MIRTLFTMVAGLIAVPAFAAETKYALTGENTAITFVGTKKDGKHTGGFKTVTGSATVDGTDVTTLKLDIEIATDSLFTDDEKLTAHLKAPDFFGVKDNPKATFKTTKVEKTEKGANITGDLTLLGKTKAVTFPAAVATDGATLTLSSDFKINRNDWGMTYGAGKIDDDVQLLVKVAAKK